MKLNKEEFLNDLSHKLEPLQKGEREKTLSYYTEIIDDRIENGMSEEEAVSQMEDTKTIAEKLLPQEHTSKTTSEKVFDFIDNFFTKHGYLFVLAILVFSFPIWGPIVLGAFTLIGIFFVILFVLIAAGAISSIVALAIAISFVTQSVLSALSALGVSMFCAGFAILTTIGTFKLINAISDLLKKTHQHIKTRSEKRRNSK